MGRNTRVSLPDDALEILPVLLNTLKAATAGSYAAPLALFGLLLLSAVTPFPLCYMKMDAGSGGGMDWEMR